MEKHGHFFWNELMTTDVEKVKAFYHDTLGWEYEAMEMGDMGTYWVIKDGDTALGGMMNMSGPGFEGMSEHWMSYIAVDDIDARVEKARKAGATIVSGPFDVPGVGRMSTMKQPDGATIAWMTPAD